MESHFTFTNSLDYEVKNIGGEQVLEVSGDISTTDLDLVNDICSKACLVSMRDQIEKGNIKLDLEHEAFRGSTNEEKEINKSKLPRGRLIEPTIKEVKRADGSRAFTLGIKGLINANHPEFQMTKKNIEEKFLDAFSIAFIPTKARKSMKNNEEVRILDDVRLLNVALTGNPVNTSAQMKQIAVKSVTALEEYKEEKKTDPALADRLEVKDQKDQARRTAERNKILEEDDEDEDEETKRYGRGGKPKNKIKKKAYEKDGAHAHTELEPLGLHDHPEIEQRMSSNFEFLFDQIIANARSEPETPNFVTKSRLRENLKIYMAGSGSDKYFRNGKEVDPKTGELLNSTPSGDEIIKLEDNTMSNDDPAKPQDAPAAPAADAPVDAPANAPADTSADTPAAPAADSEGKAMSEIKSLNVKFDELKSSVDAITAALSKPVNGAQAQDTNPQTDLKDQANGPTSVLGLCQQ